MPEPMTDSELVALWDRAYGAGGLMAQIHGKDLRPCQNCGLKVIHTGDGRHPCGFCGKSL